ncbi:MAG: YhdP family protein [Granulosicoccus sp.]
MIKSAARHTVRVSYLITGFLLILLALFTLTARVGLPLASGYKSHIESRVSDYLRSPVQIGDLSLRWDGFGPLLRAKEVTVFETAERVVTLDEILIDINLAKSLMRGLPIITELSLVGASLVVEADSDGQLRLHGMESMRTAATDNSVAAVPATSEGVDVVAWLFNAGKVGLLDTQLTLIDMKNESQVVFENLNIRAENENNLHQLRVDADLPASLGGRRLEAGIDLIGSPRRLSESDGNLYLSAESVDVPGLRDLLALGGVAHEEWSRSLNVETMATVELWGQWKNGEFVSARGPVEFGAISNADTGQRLLDSASAQLKFWRADNSTDIQVTGFQAALGDAAMSMEQFQLSKATQHQETLPPVSDDIALDENLPSVASADNRKASWELSASASVVPAELATRLAALALTSGQPDIAQAVWNSSSEGGIKNLEIRVSDTANVPMINLSAQFDDLAFKGKGPLPALGPVNGKLDIKNSVGTLNLAAVQMPLAWSAVTDQQLSIDSLQTTIDINLVDWKRVLLGADVQLADNGIDTSTRIKATFASGASPHLDVQSRFSATDITELKAWLPRKKLNKAATQWLDNAIAAGSASDGSLLLFGNVSDFPFDQGKGAFQASVDIKDGKLAFLPNWPSASNINGTLELNGLTLTGVAENSSLDRFNVSKTSATIGNLAVPVLSVTSTASGSLQDVVNFGVTGPLRGFLEPAIGDMSGTGDTEMDLSLAVSLFKRPADTDIGAKALSWRPFSVDGSVFLENNDVTFGRAELVLDNAKGAVNFNEQGILINNIGGRLLGHDVRLSGATAGRGKDADTRLIIKGAMEANDLLAHYGNPLDRFIRGASQWTATITAPHSAQRILTEGVGLDIESDLVGSELLLPTPFNKGTSVAKTFSLSTAFRDPDVDQFWQARYGDELTAQVRVVDQTLYSLLIELGESRVADASAALSQPGIRLQGNVQRLAADRWIETIAQYIDSIPEGEGEPELILPVFAKLNTDSLVLGSRSLGKAALQANTDDTYLNFVVSNQALTGNMRYPRKHWEKSTALKARIDKLDWSVIDALREETPLTRASTVSSRELDPRILPPVEARVRTLIRDDVRIRDLVLRAQPNVSGLDITTLGFAYETMRMVGQGHWYLRDPQSVGTGLAGKHTTQLNLVLQSDDFGIGFDEVGLSGIIDDAEGSIEMKIDWPGPLYKPEIAKLDGSIKVDMRSGSIVPLEPGAGRMVGLFAFQALPRRLNLDFKDMTAAGLAFESIAGRIDIDNGVAQVPLLQLKGPIGVVDIVGNSDLNTQQFDQQVTVLPRVSAALPIIGAISGGASAGIGALVAAGLLKALGIDFDRLGLRTYHLTGNWMQPVFTPMTSDSLGRR